MFNRVNLNVEIPNLKVETKQSGYREYIKQNGTRYPSITTVLSDYNKPALDRWRKRVGPVEAKKVSKAAVYRGNSLHTMIEQYLDNQPINSIVAGNNPGHVLKFKTLKKYLDENLNNIHLQETAMFSDSLKVAGRVDLISEYAGKLSIVDFKGSNREKKEEWIQNYLMQAAGYAVMYYELTGRVIKQIVIMIAVDDGSIQQFIRNPKDYVGPLQNEINKFYEKHGNVYLPKSIR